MLQKIFEWILRDIKENLHSYIAIFISCAAFIFTLLYNNYNRPKLKIEIVDFGSFFSIIKDAAGNEVCIVSLFVAIHNLSVHPLTIRGYCIECKAPKAFFTEYTDGTKGLEEQTSHKYRKGFLSKRHRLESVDLMDGYLVMKSNTIPTTDTLKLNLCINSSRKDFYKQITIKRKTLY